MKKLLLIVFVFIAVISNAQYSNNYKNKKDGWNSPQLYIPVSILATTFTINKIGGYNLTHKQRDLVAITGIVTSVATHFIFKKIRNKKRKIKRIFK